VKFTPENISFSLNFIWKTRNNILFKEKNHNNAKIPRQIKTVADGTSVYKSRPTPSWSPSTYGSSLLFDSCNGSQ